jgi:tRNA A37 threonylcarbamoyladenosine synthetase subunit TsaC/SUA5/YrdC
LQDLAHLTHLDHEIAVIIDSGLIEIAPASTHLQCESAGITLLREGAITRSEIEKAIPAVVIS